MLTFTRGQLSCLLLVLLAASVSCEGLITSPWLPDSQPERITVLLEDVRMKKTTLQVEVCGSPKRDSCQWLIPKGSSSKDKVNSNRFNCSNGSELDPENCRVYDLTIDSPQVEGHFIVRFTNNKGETEFHYIVKGDEDFWTGKYFYIIVGAGSALVVSAFVTIVVISVVSCKRRARRRRKRENEAQQLQEEAPLTMSPPPPYAPQQQQVAGINKKRPIAPKTPPKPQQIQFDLPDYPERPVSQASASSDPSHPSNCACGTLKVARSRDACEAGSSLYPDEAEIAEAIAHTFRRLRTKPTTLNINMFRSRRLSRSVPDLLSPHGKSRSASARKGQNVGEEEEEGEERDEDDLELHKTRRQNGKRGRQKQKAKKTTFARHDPTVESTIYDAPFAHKRPTSCDTDCDSRFFHNTSLEVHAGDSFFRSKSGSDVIEVSSSRTRESKASGEYISMVQPQFYPPAQPRSPGEAPQPCRTPSRIYENLQSDPYYYARERAPMMPPSAFSYGPISPHMLTGHVTTTSPSDETKTRRSHESTTVRIAVRKE